MYLTILIEDCFKKSNKSNELLSFLFRYGAIKKVDIIKTYNDIRIIGIEIWATVTPNPWSIILSE